MDAIYHQQVLRQAVGARVSPTALAIITQANLHQDSLSGVLRPEFHFDNNLLEGSLAYVESQRLAAAQAAAPQAAWEAFGRLSHAVQDFYSHSNYVALWLEQFPAGRWPSPEAIDGLDPAILRHARLVTARIYLPLEALCLFPALRGLVKPLLPRDSHAWVNLDSPETGPYFPYSLVAAVQRTAAEFDRTLAAIGETSGEAAGRRFLP